MHHWRLWVCLFFSSSLAWAEPAPEKSVEEIAKTVRASLLTISHPSRDQNNTREGCGFVVSDTGLIATNLHVIGDSRAITVTTSEGRALTVEQVYASDRRLDLALLKVKETDLVPLPLGDSSDLPDGMSVVAIGHPQGLRQSVVNGVISAVRDFDGVKMIQLAIPIEPGNSGGPLLDRRGRVIGIPTMKSAQTENIGFAMPVNALKLLLEKPNPVPMDRWVTVGQLNPRKWRVLQEGTQWRQHSGSIQVEGLGDGFGGRALCLYQQDPPEIPYEVSVAVRLEDESGAAGLVFAADGQDKHYGFYPTNGKLRLTHFDGPTVFNWNILADIASPVYRAGDWNRLLVKVEADRITAYVNGERVLESQDQALRGGKVGLCKFRQTKAHFKDFSVGRDLAKWGDAPPLQDVARLQAEIQTLVESKQGPAETPASLAKDSKLSQSLLEAKAKQLDSSAARLRAIAQELHQRGMEEELAKLLGGKADADIDLFHAGLLIAKLADRSVDVDSHREQLKALADELRGRIPAEATDEAKLTLLTEHLFRDQGFHGSRIDYYTAENSYLSSVLDDREGIPITLSVLFLELAKSIGVPDVVGIPLPGHFVVQYRPAEENRRLLIDVYDAGKVISLDEAQALSTNTAGLPLRPEDLQPASKKAILTRMLRNLINLHLDSDDSKQALPFLGLLLSFAPDEAPERLSRAILGFQNGLLTSAREDVAWILLHRPPNVNLERMELLRQQIDSRLGGAAKSDG